VTHDPEAYQQAEDLFVLEGLTQQEVAARTGIPLRTIELWSADKGWVAMRREYRRAQSEIRRNKMLFRLALLRQAMDSLDPQKTYAWATVERAIKEERTPTGGGGSGGQPDARKIETPQEAIEALREALERKINLMLSRPEALDFKDARRAYDLIAKLEDLKGRYAGKAEETSRRGLTDETVDDIRRRILGIDP